MPFKYGTGGPRTSMSLDRRFPFYLRGDAAHGQQNESMRQFNGKGEVRELDITIRRWLDGVDQDGRVAADIYLDHIASQHEEPGLRVQEQR